jgi:hypothetical protein
MTHWWQKILFRYNLLCNNCNWEFVGFAVPGTVSMPKRKSLAEPQRRSSKKQTDFLAEKQRFRRKANAADAFESFNGEQEENSDSIKVK